MRIPFLLKVFSFGGFFSLETVKLGPLSIVGFARSVLRLLEIPVCCFLYSRGNYWGLSPWKTSSKLTGLLQGRNPIILTRLSAPF